MSTEVQHYSPDPRIDPYDAVRVLLVCWEEPFASELRALELALSSHFPKWIWRTLLIPTQKDDMTPFVRDYIFRFALPWHDINELLIVIYGGHGEFGEVPTATHAASTSQSPVSQASPSASRLLWRRSSPSRQFVDWSSVQDRELFLVNKDTLVILDSYYTGTDIPIVRTSQKDILAATSQEIPQRTHTDMRSPTVTTERSFTSYLRRAALSFARPFTVDEVRLEIIRLGFSENPVYRRRPEPPNHAIILTPSETIPPQAPWPDHIDIEVDSELKGVKFRIRVHWNNANIPNGDWQTRVGQADQLIECKIVPKNREYLHEKRGLFPWGQVFAIPWSDKTEPPGYVLPSWASTKIWRQERIFIVVRDNETSCLAVEVHANQTQTSERHAIMFIGKSPPRDTEKTAVRIKCNDPRLDPVSFIVYGTVIAIQPSVPVRRIGRITEEYQQVFANNLASVRSFQTGSSIPATKSIHDKWTVQAGPSTTQEMDTTAMSAESSRSGMMCPTTIQSQAHAAVEGLISQGVSREQALHAVQKTLVAGLKHIQQMQVQKQQQARPAEPEGSDNNNNDNDNDNDNDDDDDEDEEESEKEEDVLQALRRWNIQLTSR